MHACKEMKNHTEDAHCKGCGRSLRGDEVWKLDGTILCQTCLPRELELRAMTLENHGAVDACIVRECLEKGIRKIKIEEVFSEEMKSQEMHSSKKKSHILAISLDDAAKQNELVVREKTKHLGITTTRKETVVSPTPSRFEVESESSIGGGIGLPLSIVRAFASQKDKRTLSFEETENARSRLKSKTRGS